MKKGKKAKSMESASDIPQFEILEVRADDGPKDLYLTKDELNALQLFQFQARAFEAEMQLEVLKKDAYLAKIDPESRLAKMMALIRGRSNEAAIAKQAYTKTIADIEARLSISLKEWSYNDENGLLSRVDQ